MSSIRATDAKMRCRHGFPLFQAILPPQFTDGLSPERNFVGDLHMFKVYFQIVMFVVEFRFQGYLCVLGV